MKKPNLKFNYIYPFYTLSEHGRKKFLHYSNCSMHISDEKVLQITTRRETGKVNKVDCEFIKDRSRIYKLRTEEKLVHYNVFAEHSRTFFNVFTKALRSLDSEPCYRKTMVFSSLFKFNECIEMEMNWDRFTLKIGPVDYIIEKGKYIRLKESPFANSDTEAGRTWEAIGKAFDEHTSFTEVEANQFNDRLDRIWDVFFPYFEAPKFMRKNVYIPK